MFINLIKETATSKQKDVINTGSIHLEHNNFEDMDKMNDMIFF